MLLVGDSDTRWGDAWSVYEISRYGRADAVGRPEYPGFRPPRASRFKLLLSDCQEAKKSGEPGRWTGRHGGGV